MSATPRADRLESGCWPKVEKCLSELRDSERELAAMTAERDRLAAEKAILRTALDEIAEGSGKLNIDPLQHATNVIEKHIKLAGDALEATA